MNLDIFKMEIKRMRRFLLIALLAPAFYSALIMVFYIAFSEVFMDMQGLFDNASLQGLLKAFSMDQNTFSYILSYYVAYSGVYISIMGIVFATVIGVKMFSGELKSGTYEFMYANPVSRRTIFVSKLMVMVTYLFALNLLIFLVGLTSIELLKTRSPLLPWLSDENVQMLEAKIDDNPNVINNFKMDDNLFYQVIYSQFEHQFDTNNVDVDQEIADDLLNIFLLNPDQIFDELLKSPDVYMSLLNIGDEESFINQVQEMKLSYFQIKNEFKSNSEIGLMYFKMYPKPFLDQIISEYKVEAFSNDLALSNREKNDLFVYYSLGNFIKLSFTTFMAMLTVAMFINMLIVLIPHGKMSAGMASGVAFVFYLLNMMSNIAQPISKLKYITPLSYINMNVMDINYHTDGYAWIVMIAVIAITFIISFIAIKKSDLLYN